MEQIFIKLFRHIYASKNIIRGEAIMLELLIENLIIPYGQSFLYDISKSIYQKVRGKDNLQKKLRKAVEGSVEKVMTYANESIHNGIVQSIVRGLINEYAGVGLHCYCFNMCNSWNINR